MMSWRHRNGVLNFFLSGKRWRILETDLSGNFVIMLPIVWGLIFFVAKSARQNRAHEQDDVKDETMRPSQDQRYGWQAKRSLDNELYRNVELEVWEDSKNGNLLSFSTIL